jgi:hypothetical protein
MTQPQVATVPAAVEAALSAQQVTTAKECGARFFNSKIEAIETARVYAKEVIGIEPSYDQWEQGRINWCNGYVEANPENTGNAADAEWKRFVALLHDLFGVDPVKPKSTNKAATKKREERSAKMQKLVEHYTQNGQKTARELEGLRMAAFEQAAKGNSAAEKMADELKKVIRVINSEENKELGAQRAELRKQVRAAAGKCTSLDRLQQALDILDEDNAFTFEDSEEDEDEDES